jgi:gliding motility-associated-like protein
MKKLIFLFILLSFGIQNTWATHLVGGSIGYEYLGQTAAGYYRYKIILTTYTNCQETGPNAANPIYWNGPEANIEDAGIYAHDAINNPTGGAATKTKIADVPLTLTSSLKIEPNLPSGCGTGVSTCIYKGVYEGTIDLGTLDPTTGTVSPSFTGYHVFYERCCRNNVIDNLNNLMSMGFYAYIAPDLVTNNSPVFTDDPVPFLCIGDTVTLLNSAYDPDGDEIQFSFVTPYDDNVSGSGNPAPGPSNFLQWPIDEVTYQFGYSTALPFGVSGGSNIIASNGLTEYYTTAGGNYVVAVELKEYRSNILVGVSRRDIQLLAITCPVNPPPVINPNVGTTNQSFTIEEGETLCFDFGYNDPNGDSLTLTANGQIFDPLIINPPATITPNPIASPPGIDTMSTTFCWTTSCGQSQALPYQFQVSAEDRGCPPKTTNAVYEITVESVDPPTDIFGDLVYCQNANGSYWTPNLPGVTYSWSFNGGNIVQSFGDSVVVNWTTAGTGTVILNAVNSFGCASAPLTKNITITPAPSVDAGSSTSICEGDTISLVGTTSATPGYTSAWTPTPTLSNSSSIITDAFPINTTTYYLTIDIGGGCSGIDSIQIDVISNTIEAGNDITICAGDTAILEATGDGDTFVWTPIDSLDQVNSATTNAWPNATTMYFVDASNSTFGCNTTDSVTVNVNPIPSSNINFVLNGSAANLGNNEYLLTPNTLTQGGSAWNNSFLNLNQPFRVDVDLYFGTNDANGADGIAFVLQETSTALVQTGGTLGYGNISPSFDIEFDTYQNGINGDPASDHIAIQRDGILVHTGANNLFPPVTLGSGNVEDGNWYNTIIEWDPLTKNLIVTFDGSVLINITYDIGNNIFNGNNQLYWGFTGSTGGSSNEQKFRYNNETFLNSLIDRTICENDSIALNAPVDGVSFLWTPNTNIDDNTIKTPTFKPTTTSTYFFEAVGNSGCIYRDTFDINVNPLPNVLAGNDQTICEGLDITLNASGNATTYTWDNGVIDGVPFNTTLSQDYILTGESSNGCIDFDTVTVNVNQLPNIDAGNNIVVCIGDSTQLNATGGDTYNWTPSTNLSNNGVANPWASPPTTTQYNLVGTDTNGCINQDSIIISVNPLPTLSTGNDQIICEGDSVEINAFGGTVYNWISTDSISDTTVSNPTVWPTTTTTYFVLISDVNTCADTTSVTVNVNPKPNVEAGNDQSICFGDSTSLNSSGNAITYSWDSGITDGVLFPVITTQDYILVGVDANGCSNSDSVTITSLALPNIDAGNNQSICIGDSVQLIATGGANYLWTPNTFISDNTIANPIVNPNINTQYFVLGTDISGCKNIDSIDVTINSLPSLNISNDTAICLGDTINVIASGGVQFEWLNLDSISNINISNPDVWPSLTSSYDVIVTGGNNCFDTATINITVNQLPSISAGTNQDICFGDTTNFNASGGVTYLWNFSTEINTLTDPNSDVWPIDTTTYYLTGTDINGCSNTDSVFINIIPLPDAEAGPNLWVCPGGSIQLNATGGLSYSWSPSATLDFTSISNPVATPNSSQQYNVAVTDANNCTNYDSVLVEVFAAVPTDAGGDTLIICENLSIILGGNPTSPSGSIYLWTPSTLLSNGTDANPIASPIAPTWFFVETTNDTCSGIDSVFVNLHPSINPDAGSDQQICIGDSIFLLATGGTEYVWTPILNSLGDSILSNDTINNPNSYPTDTTQFNVTITDSNGCVGLDSVEIIVNSIPNFDLGPNTSICIFDSLTLQANDGDIYSWTPNHAIDSINIANPTIFTEVDTTYFVGVTDSNGCFNSDSIEISVNPLPNVSAGINDTICFGSTTQLIATGALNYVWSPIDSLSNPNIPYPTADPSINTEYIVLGTDGQGCSNSDTVGIVVLPLPNAFAGSDTSICPGQSTPLNATGGLSYKWITNINLTNFLISNPIAEPDSTTQYIVQVTDSNNCQTTDTVMVYVFSPAEADAGFNISSCANVPVQLNASGGELYNWSPSNYVNHDTINNPLAFPDKDMDFIVEVTDTNGCMDTDTMRITVFTISIDNDTLFCIGDSMQAFVSGDPATIFNWTPTIGVSDSSSFEPWLSPTVTTTYTVVATNAQGCTFQDEVLIEVPNPIASFDTTQLTGCEGVVINFTNTSNTDLSFVWNFSDGTNSTDTYVEKVFDFNQLAGAILEVTDQYGCQDTAAYNYATLGFDDYFINIDDIPNVFTPNNDGNNDVFEIKVAGKLYECTDLKIFNRWGQVQFLSSGNNIKWDGRNSVGMSVPDGTYFYTLSIKEKKYSGAINIYK